jgi:glucan phosphoethanolaminetransferase (alkaline phosphatase superfamily)
MGGSCPIPFMRIFNYLYFGLFFLVLFVVHTYHLFIIEPGGESERFLFLVEALAQSFIEALLLALCAALLPRLLCLPFIFLASLLFLSHLIDFYLIRLMDISVWHGLNFLADESWQNFLEMLSASNVSIKTWLLGGGLSLLSIGLLMALFYIAQHFSDKKPLLFSQRLLGKTLSFSLAGLLCWEAFLASFAQPQSAEKYQRALPWKRSLLQAFPRTISLPSSLRPFEGEKELLKKLDRSDLSLKQRPDLFLFVIESLRENFLTSETAPHLFLFNKEEKNHCRLSFSNSNATHTSWFSLFHSKLPLYWGEVRRQNWISGSPALRILKKAGYQIHAYSSSRLSFYKMDQLLFGEKRELIDALHEFPSEEGRQPWESDRQTMQKLNEDLLSIDEKGGRLFIVFLESTHFDYSWPEHNHSLFTPFTETINYLKISYTQEDLEGIKNSYRNAIHYIDDLFGQFLTTLKVTSRWEDATIVLTGDHGEEFFEQGHLFHASNLSEMQTRVPIYYRFGAPSKTTSELHTCQQITSHIDIFPTLLHHVAGDDRFGCFFQGHSLLRALPRPFVVAARYNASRAPYEFFIHNGRYQLTLRFCNERAIFHSKKLRVISIKSDEESSVPCTSSFIQEEFSPALSHLFSNYF